MAFSVYFSETAKKDLSDIYAYSQKVWGVQKAKTYLIQLKQRIILLSENPFIASARFELGQDVYSFPVQRHMIYLSLAKSAERKMIILAVMHQQALPTIYREEA